MTEKTIEGCLVLSYPGSPSIRIDARALDRILAVDQEIVLEVDELRVALLIGEGADAARVIAAELGECTRSAPISHRYVYEFEKQRLDLAKQGTLARVPFLFVGDVPVIASESVIYIGSFACTISDVQKYADVQAPISLPNDGVLQAALAMLVVADRSRNDDLNALEARIVEYERMLAGELEEQRRREEPQ